MIIDIESTDNYTLIFQSKVFIINSVPVLEYSVFYKQKIKVIDRVILF